MHPKQVAILLLAALALSAQATITVTPQEMAEKTQWVQQNLLTAANTPPFSFTYNGVSSSVLLPTWSRSETDTVLDTNRTQHLIVWSNNLLQVSCVAIEYNDYPLVEWTVYMTNTGGATTPVIQNIQGLNTTITRTNGPEFVLNGNQGDSASATSYEPYQIALGPSSVNSFSPPSYSGKSCDTSGWPYYNLQTPGGGMIVAIGWPGQWASSFTRDSGNDLQIQAGQQTTYLVLNPGEQIRTPLIALMFWQGTDVVRSQNIWRHWYMAHEIPVVNGQPPSPILQVQGDSIGVVDAYLSAGIHPDILWRDADWYPDNGPFSPSWLNTGTWEVNTNLYPDGFLPTSQAVNAVGTKFLLWFEPERVGNTNNSFLATNNPSWLLPGTGSTVGAILNEGNPGAFNWLTNHITGLIVSNGINWYREDMNGGGPLPAWQETDAANRQGITENFYVQGHLAYWDALLAMNPGLRIDCCGSGGRRNDLEAMRRSVPLDRSDFNGVTTLQAADGEQCQTYGLASWLPFQGTGCGLFDVYSFRSSYIPSFGLNYIGGEIQPNQQAYGECKRIAPIMLNGDYYPLTPYSQADNVWMAWQFDWPNTSQGCVQIFRRTNSPVASMAFQLQGLNPSQIYDVRNFDTGDLGWYAGSNLMVAGLTVQLSPRQAAILYYTNAQGVGVSATANTMAGISPLSVQFSAAGTNNNGAALKYAWAFGDGGASTNQNPLYTYLNNGTYVAQVTVSDGQGDTNSAQITITVIPAQVKVSATASTVAGFRPLVVQFGATGTDNDGATLTYAWTFGDGGVSTEQNLKYIYYNDGRYVAQVTANDGRGDTNSTQITITVVGLAGHTMLTTLAGYTRPTTLTNFPALMVFGTNMPGFSYSQMASSNGWDLVFINSDGTPLNYEIDSWNPNGNSYVWVQVPLLTSNANFRAYWGDANLTSIPAQCTTNGSVWANGYAGVWHLANKGGVLSTNDSSANGDNGTNDNVLATNGVVDGAAWFNGANATLATEQATNPIVANQQVTMSAWVYPLGGQVLMMEGNDDAQYSWGLEWGGNASLLFTLGSTTDWLSDGGATASGRWSYVTGIINGNNKYLFVNGLLRASNTFSGTLQPPVALPFWIGAQNRPSYNYWLSGALDEVRVSSIARSSDWVWAEYMNMASNSVFNSYGVVTNYVLGVDLSAAASSGFGFAPLGVQFTATGFTGSGAPVSYAWTFGDGVVSTNQNPLHTYYSSGKYVAQVTASDGQGNSNSVQIAVVVVRPQKTMDIGFTGYPRSETLTNFPVLVELGTNLSNNGFSYNQMASPNGWDLIFMSPGQIQPLNYEIEKWNTNGTSYVWVQVPLLTSNASFQAYWGDTNLASAPAPSTTNGSVWANGYVSVWHLGGLGDTTYDSTSNHTAGTVVTTYGTCTPGAPGVIGDGCAFGGGYISASAATLPGGSDPRTVSTWFMKNTAATTSPGEEILGYGGNSTAGDRFGLWISGNGTAAYAIGVEDQGAAIQFPWTWDGNWHYLAAVLPMGQSDLSGVNLYYDGTENTSATGSGPIDTVQTELCFAGLPGYHTSDLSYSFSGVLDEVRISDVARSTNWLWAEYMNMASNAVFNGYGAVASYIAPLVSVTLGIAGNRNNVVISWPTNVVADGVLQVSSDLVNWTNSTAPVIINGTNNTVTIQPADTVGFYRLCN